MHFRQRTAALTRGTASSVRGIALGTTCLLTLACSDVAPGAGGPDDYVGVNRSGLTLTVSSPTTYALASGAVPGGITVSGGTGPYSCAISSNVSGGASCSVSGGVISYTTGATAGYNIKSERTNDYLHIISGSVVAPGGALGSTADLWKMVAVGSKFTFQAKSTGNYVRSAGNSGNIIVADVGSSSAGVFGMQNCNGAGDPGVYNRFGFSTSAGTSPYWNTVTTTEIDALNSGSGVACDASTSGLWDAFFLSPGTDTLTITDTASNTGTLTVSVENPVAFSPPSTTVRLSTAISPVQTWGGSGIFTGGSSGCSVITNNSGGGACTVTGSGVVSYTAGSSNGTDTIRVTDSQGHTGTFNVTASSLIVSPTTSYAIAASSLGQSVAVSGGTAPYSCSVLASSSGASSCSVSGGNLSYTTGATAGYNIMADRTGDYLRLVAASGGPYAETGGALGSSAELWKIGTSGSGYTFQAMSTGNYLRSAGTISTGNDLVADVAAASADVYTMQNCNGTGNPGNYRRFGFSSATGSSPYWQAKSVTVDTVNNGSAAACDPTLAGRWEAFFLNPATDSLLVTDSASHSTIVTVTVENPVTFWPGATSVAASSAIPTVQAWGGSGVFTGGSSGCTVTTNASGGGACSITGYGSISYTAGSGTGTDILTVTDSQGHTGTYTVSVGSLTLTQISASKNYYACARASDGTARCWGENDQGQLGNNSLIDSLVPVAVSGLTGVSSVAAGGYSACALLTNNTIKCWGDNTYGQLGDGTTTDKLVPSSAISGITTATAIGVGLNFGCALISGGTVKCWGDNLWGQLGDTGTNSPQSTSAVSVSGVSGATAIAVGSFHACALVGSGAIKCWGDGTMGAVGNGAAAKTFTPASVTGITGATSIAAGEASSCAVLSDTTVKCWGDESYGALGNGVATLSAYSTVPVAVSSLTGVSSVSIGYPFACALLSSGIVDCWGRNVEGELGDTTSTNRAAPVQVVGLTTTSSISAGGHFVCSVPASGLNMCWGYNPYGALGNATTTDSHYPTPVAFGIPRYNFESSTQGWSYKGNATSVAQSAVQVYFGTRSLQVNMSGTNGSGYATLASPGIAAGTVITYRLWIPNDGSISAVQPYVIQGSAGNYAYTGNYQAVSGLSQGNWNTLTVQVPSNASALQEMGVQFVMNGTVTTAAYIDAIDW